MKRILKILGWIVAFPIVLVVLLMAVVYLPPVQDFAVKKATTYASEATGMHINIERLRLTWLLDIDLQGTQVIDNENDTLLLTEHCVVDLDLGKALNKEVEVETIVLKGALVHSKQLIGGIQIDGSIEKFSINEAPVALEDGIKITLPNTCLQKADVTLRLLPTDTPEDTTSSSTKLCFEVGKLTIADTHFKLDMDSLSIDTHIGELTVKDGLVDLLKNHFEASLALEDTKAQLELGETLLDIPTIEHFSATGAMLLPSADSTRSSSQQSLLLYARNIDLRLPHSSMNGDVFVGDSLAIDINSEWGREDVFQAAKPWLTPMLRNIFSRPSLHMDAAVNGSVNHAYLKRLRIAFPTWLTMTIKGEAHNLVDSVADLNANLLLVNEHDKGQMKASAKAHLDHSSTATNGGINYKVNFATKHLHIGHILHQDSIGFLTMQAQAEGQGIDIQSALTQLKAKLHVDELQWKTFNFEDISLNAEWARREGNIDFNIYHPNISVEAGIAAQLSDNHRQMEFKHLLSNICVNHFDLQPFGIFPEDSISASMNLRADATGGIQALNIDGMLSDIILQQPDTALELDPLHLTTILSADTTQLAIQTGDFDLALNGRGSYVKILDQIQHFTDLLMQQIEERRLNQQELTRRLPIVKLSINSGTDNNIYRFLKANGVEYDDIKFRMSIHPDQGIKGGGYVYGTRTEAAQLDTLYLRIGQDSLGVNFDARACNGKDNPQYTFDTRLHALLLPEGLNFNVQYLDEKGKKGVDLGAEIAVKEDGFHIHLDPLDPVLAYRTFHLNSDNYLTLRRDQHIFANLNLLADDGTGFLLYSTPNEEALQDISLGFNHFNLGELTNVLPYMPRITGFLHGDAHLVQTKEHISVATELEIDDMTYEGAALGQIGLQAVYLPNSDGSHFVDGSLLRTGMPMANFSGSYIPTEDEGQLKVDVDLERLPIDLINGFLPADLISMQGAMMGDLHVNGTLSNPSINGNLINRDMQLHSDLYSLDLRFDNDTMTIRNGRLDLNRLTVHTAKPEPLTIDGRVDISDLAKIGLNITMKAKNYELINAKKSQKAVAYGKVYVDIDALLRGTLDDLRLNGKLNVLGNSNLTYVLKDSPLTVEDELADLVTFTDFRDTVAVEPQQPTNTENLHMNLRVAIDNTTQVTCMLSADGASYVKLEGGGDLELISSPEKDMELKGRYTINDGTLKYTMMIIPLKAFVIKNGSYVEFNGPIDNPTLNITATERMRVNITQDNQPRSVNFDVGLGITQTLQNLGLDFKLEATNDASIQNELAMMTTEQRSKAAITMLATGMYVSDTGTSSTGTSALNAFLQSQINNVTGKVLKDVDLSLGIDVGESATGGYTTDYSFRFAKRFWGNRISIIIGGSVGTGNNNNTNNSNLAKSLIDNISVEYRLDKSATRYVNVFYNKSYKSVLDGEVIEMGAGLVLRRKSERLGELFIFKSKNKGQETKTKKSTNKEQKDIKTDSLQRKEVVV